MFSWIGKRLGSSSCAGWKSKAREFLPLAAGLALTVTAIFMARQRISAVERDVLKSAAPVDVVVAAAEIPAGTAFSGQNVAKLSVPSSGTSRRNVPASEFELLLGATARSALSPGEPILWTDVEEPLDVDRFSQTIPAGRRAITLEADASATFGGLIRPGDRVDIRCEGEGDPPRTAWFHDIPVIAVDRHYNRPPAGEDALEIATVTISVTPEEGRRLSAAREGKIRWFLRNPEDRSGGRGVSRVAATGRPPVEIWKAGIREVAGRPAAVGGVE